MGIPGESSTHVDLRRGRVFRCGCGQEHQLSSQAASEALQAFIDGHGHTVGSNGVIKARCLLELVKGCVKNG